MVISQANGYQLMAIGSLIGLRSIRATVSLYAVDRGMHEDILKWDEERQVTKSREGITKIPERFRLDSIVLDLKEI